MLNKIFGSASASSEPVKAPASAVLLRRATHAGSWYDDDPRRLASVVSRHLSAAEAKMSSSTSDAPPRRIFGLIGPHAGISYCGATAGHAYMLLRRWLYSGDPEAAKVSRIFMLGPSHHKWIEGVEVSSATAFETPFGNLQVDRDAIAEVVAACKTSGLPCAPMELGADEDEHSLELHLPFLSHVLHFPPTQAAEQPPQNSLASRVKLVPIVVGGGCQGKGEGTLGRILAPYIGAPENIFVVSSDFCHWGARFRYTHHFEKSAFPEIGDAIEAMDRRGMQLIGDRDMTGWSKYLQDTKNTICGRSPITAVMAALDAAEARRSIAGDGTKAKIEFVHYSQSSRCKSASDSSVSYASAVFSFA